MGISYWSGSRMKSGIIECEGVEGVVGLDKGVGF